MNWKIGFFIALLGWAGTFFYMNANPKCPEAPAVVTDSNDPTPINITCKTQGGAMDAGKGCQALKDYETYLKGGAIPRPANVGSFLGKQICVGELAQIVRDLGAKDPYIYAMLAIKDGDIDIIFVGKDAESNDVRPKKSLYYYDFGDPCPSSCPDYLTLSGACIK